MAGSIILIPVEKFSALIAAILGGVITSVAITIIIFMSFYQGPMIRIRDYIVNWFPKHTTIIKEKSDSLIRALASLRQQKTFTMAISFSFLVWVFMVLSYGLFLKAVGIALPIGALIAGGSTQVLINTLPNIAGLGTMEAGWLLGLGLGNISPETALLGAVVVDLATLVGTLAIWGIVMIISAVISKKTNEKNFIQSLGHKSWYRSKK